MQSTKYLHVDEELRDVCDAGDHIRCRVIFRSRFVTHRHVEDVLNHVLYQVGLPIQTRAWGIVVYGEPGSGKTQLSLAVEKRLQDAMKKPYTGLRKPVILITMTGAREARTIFNRILDALGAPVSPSMRVSDREKLALDLMKRAGVRLLIVDEVQDVLASTARQQRGALDAIKLIMNNLSIPVLALGTAKAAEAMREDPHLAARFDHRALPTWGCDKDTRALLAAIERTIPLRMESNLASPALVKFIVERTNGCLARMVRLINDAAVFAIQTQRECIDMAMLELAATDAPDPRLFHENPAGDR
jgi:hypothetical protein